MLLQSSTDTSQPFVALLTSTNSDPKSERFVLPNLGLATASYLNQVKLLEPPVSDTFLINSDSEFQGIQEIKQEKVQEVSEPIISRIDISNNLVTLLQSELPTNITQIGL